MAFTGYSNSGTTYSIGSQKGMDFVESAPKGSKLTDTSDGSVWYKNPDGSTTVTKDGDAWHVGASLNNFNNVMQEIAKSSYQTSARQLAYAQQQQDWSANQANIANQFNAAEAAKNRDWQAFMSNTAHQREVADLKAAGLNPVLSAMNGNGASVSSGATANAVMPSGEAARADSQTQALVSMMSSMLAAQTSIANQAVSAKTAESVADKYTAMTGFVAQMEDTYRRWATEYNAELERWRTEHNGRVSMWIAEKSAAVQAYAAELQAEASKYGAWLSSDTALKIAANQLEWQTNHPNNFWQELNTLFSDIFGDDSNGPASQFWNAITGDHGKVNITSDPDLLNKSYNDALRG